MAISRSGAADGQRSLFIPRDKSSESGLANEIDPVLNAFPWSGKSWNGSIDGKNDWILSILGRHQERGGKKDLPFSFYQKDDERKMWGCLLLIIDSQADLTAELRRIGIGSLQLIGSPFSFHSSDIPPLLLFIFTRLYDPPIQKQSKLPRKSRHRINKHNPKKIHFRSIHLFLS